MDNTHYIHKLEQIGCELRDAAADMEEFHDRIKDLDEPQDELRLRFGEFLLTSTTEDIVVKLHKLVAELKADEDLEAQRSMLDDMNNCNEHAVRLVTAQLAVSKLLTGK